MRSFQSLLLRNLSFLKLNGPILTSKQPRQRCSINLPQTLAKYVTRNYGTAVDNPDCSAETVRYYDLSGGNRKLENYNVVNVCEMVSACHRMCVRDENWLTMLESFLVSDKELMRIMADPFHRSCMIRYLRYCLFLKWLPERNHSYRRLLMETLPSTLNIFNISFKRWRDRFLEDEQQQKLRTSTAAGQEASHRCTEMDLLVEMELFGKCLKNEHWRSIVTDDYPLSTDYVANLLNWMEKIQLYYAVGTLELLRFPNAREMAYRILERTIALCDFDEDFFESVVCSEVNVTKDSRNQSKLDQLRRRLSPSGMQRSRILWLLFGSGIFHDDVIYRAKIYETMFDRLLKLFNGNRAHAALVFYCPAKAFKFDNITSCGGIVELEAQSYAMRDKWQFDFSGNVPTATAQLYWPQSWPYFAWDGRHHGDVLHFDNDYFASFLLRFGWTIKKRIHYNGYDVLGDYIL